MKDNTDTWQWSQYVCYAITTQKLVNEIAHGIQADKLASMAYE